MDKCPPNCPCCFEDDREEIEDRLEASKDKIDDEEEDDMYQDSNYNDYDTLREI